MKKIVLLGLAMLLALVVYVRPAEAAVSDFQGGLIDENPSYFSVSNPNLIDNSTSTFSNYDVDTVVLTASYLMNLNAISMSAWEGTNFGINFYDQDGSLITSISKNFTRQGNKYTLPSSINGVKSVEIIYNEENSTTQIANIFEVELFGNLTDVFVAPTDFDVTNLSVSSEDVTAKLIWDSIDDEQFSHYKVYQGDEVIKDDLTSNSLDLTGLEPSTSYSFKVVAVDINGVESTGQTVSTTTKSKDMTAPAEVENLTYEVDKNNVSLLYDLPTSDNFSHIEIYREGKIIANDVVLNSYSDTGLEFDTTYQYIVKTVSDNGAKSEGKILNVTVMPEGFDQAPASPKNFKATEMNGAISLTWDKSPEAYATGYFVYINGERVSDTPIKNNTYVVTGLDNGQSYNFSVSAVGSNGKESEVSTVVTAEPSEDAMPVLKTEYSLSDVANGTASWFSSLWLIVAFAAAIPLSFYIARNVKSLFLG